MATQRATSSRPEYRLVELYRDSEHVMGSYGNILVIASLAPPSPEFVLASMEATLKVAEDYDQGVAFLVVIDSRAGPPNEASRKAIQQYYGELRDIVKGAVHIVEGEGFAAAAKRGALSLINFTMKPVFPTKITHNVQEGVSLMRKSLGPLWLKDIQPHQLEREITNLKSSLAPRSRRKR